MWRCIFLLYFANTLYILQHFMFCSASLCLNTPLYALQHFTFCNPNLHFAALYVLQFYTLQPHFTFCNTLRFVVQQSYFSMSDVMAGISKILPHVENAICFVSSASYLNMNPLLKLITTIGCYYNMKYVTPQMSFDKLNILPSRVAHKVRNSAICVLSCHSKLTSMCETFWLKRDYSGSSLDKRVSVSMQHFMLHFSWILAGPDM